MGDNRTWGAEMYTDLSRYYLTYSIIGVQSGYMHDVKNQDGTSLYSSRRCNKRGSIFSNMVVDR